MSDDIDYPDTCPKCGREYESVTRNDYRDNGGTLHDHYIHETSEYSGLTFVDDSCMVTIDDSEDDA